MTSKEMYDFSIGQIDWYTRQIEYTQNRIKRLAEEIKDSVKRDKEMVLFIRENHNPDEIVYSLFTDDYQSNDTRKLINERARYYREVKNNKKHVEHYKKEAETWLSWMNKGY